MRVLFVQGADFFEQAYSLQVLRQDYAAGHFHDWFFNVASCLGETTRVRTVFSSLSATERELYPAGEHRDVVFLPLAWPWRNLVSRYYHRRTGGVEELHKYAYDLYPRIILAYGIAFSSAIVDEIRRFGPDLVVVQDYESKVCDALLLRLPLARLTLPVIAVGTGEFPIQNWFERGIKRILLRRAARLICPNTTELGAVRKKYRSAAADFFFARGVDTGLAPVAPSSARAELGLVDDKLYILYVGRLAESPNDAKAFPVLRAACERVWERRQDFVLLVVGAGEAPRPAPFLHCAGYVKDPERLRHYYAASEFVVVPSRREGISKVVAEAMACARPVVGTAVGGIADQVVDGVTGLLVAPDDADALSARIAELLADPERCRALGLAARERAAQHLSRAAVGARFHKLFEEILGSAKQGRD